MTAGLTRVVDDRRGVTGLKAPVLWGLPSPRTGSYRVAVIGNDEPLRERILDALDREGLHARAGQLDHHATLIVIRAPRERRVLDQQLRRARRSAPGAVVVIVTGAGERIDLSLVLGGGADAVVRDDDLRAVLGPAVRAAACGQRSAPADLVHAMQPPALSHREREVLALALAGLSNSQIAERLYLAPSTVKTHISAAFRRLGVHSRREARALVNGSGLELTGDQQ